MCPSYSRGKLEDVSFRMPSWMPDVYWRITTPVLEGLDWTLVKSLAPPIFFHISDTASK